MQHYTQRVRESILPLSVAGTLPEAFQEWRFTGDVEDHERPEETCELCWQEGLRYHFQIQNDLTGHNLWVGSECILKFSLRVFEGEELLSAESAKKKLQQLTVQMRLESCLQSLERLAAAEESAILKGALDNYRKKKKLSPKQGFVVFWKLKQHNIDHSPSFFSIDLGKGQYIADIRKMPTERVHMFWKVLTPAQRTRVMELGHKSPEELKALFDGMRQRLRPSIPDSPD